MTAIVLAILIAHRDTATLPPPLKPRKTHRDIMIAPALMPKQDHLATRAEPSALYQV